jgi:hypothetical protein
MTHVPGAEGAGAPKAAAPVPAADRAIDALRVLTFRMRRWSIGILTGPSPFVLSAPRGAVNPVLRREDVIDVDSEFIADPFMIRVDRAWHMFFEVLAIRGRVRKGEIGHAVSPDGLDWKYRGIVLREDFHLSYPYVFQTGADIYLLPETGASGGIRLYRADPFPSRWVCVGTLVTGPVLVDSSPFQHDGRWWMFTQPASEPKHGTLRLFFADDLLGIWREHPRSPVVAADTRIARPAGRVVAMGDRLIRFAQDCRDGYGMRVHAIEIERLTPDEYVEAECPGNPLLDGSGHGWNRSGMHHLDAQQLEDGSWIACVDGWTNRFWDP